MPTFMRSWEERSIINEHMVIFVHWTPNLLSVFLSRYAIQEGFYDYDCWNKVFLKDLPPSKQEKIWNKLVVDGLSSRYMRHEYVKESVEFEEEFNFFPHLFVDMDDFEKMRKKIRTEEVEYREGIVEIKVTFLDEKSSK